jgi:glycosyltransferase involved in cell wall biosynthesis
MNAMLPTILIAGARVARHGHELDVLTPSRFAAIRLSPLKPWSTMPPRPHKALFVTHDTGFYGASRSLQTFLRNYDIARADLMVNRRLGGQQDLAAIQERFGAHIVAVREAWLPFDRCCKGKPPYSLRLGLRNALAAIERESVWRKMEAERYDFIYLNSIVLHPLIHERLPFILHVREIYDGTNSRVFETARRAKGLIFIDQATAEPFRRQGVEGMILNNPIDMRAADQATGEALRARWNVGQKAVFALVGVLNESKGTEFVIECFKRAGKADALLLIVGEGELSYVERCKRAAAGQDNIVFHGFEVDVASIYAASDYVVRGEAYPCIGRTIYEGLYAGCSVVIPGDDEDQGWVFEHDRFAGRLHFYPPRDVGSLTALFTRLRRVEGQRDQPRSNVADFVRGFDQFLQRVLTKQSSSAR